MLTTVIARAPVKRENNHKLASSALVERVSGVARMIRATSSQMQADFFAFDG